MILYKLDLNNRIYDLNDVYHRVILREDLRQYGFFKMLDFEKYYRWFDEEMIGRERVSELLSAIKFFVISKMPYLIKNKN